MPQADSSAMVVEIIALLVAAGSLLIAFGRARVKKEEVDALALQVAVELAKKTPELEQSLHETIQQLLDAQTESKVHRDKISEMERVIQRQEEEIRELKAENARLSAQLRDLQAALQTLQPQSNGNPLSHG
jgi:predicted RNase H-like nuclease (RuvC/YqgF family)